MYKGYIMKISKKRLRRIIREHIAGAESIGEEKYERRRKAISKSDAKMASDVGKLLSREDIANIAINFMLMELETGFDKSIQDMVNWTCESRGISEKQLHRWLEKQPGGNR